jgi:predicted phosphate transport protein (TIGR00153 family)
MLPMWLQQAIRWFLPEEGRFFDLVDQAADASHRCAELLVELLATSNREKRQVLVERIRDAEHDGDKAMKDMADALDKTFVTPIDREDLYTLTNKIESVSDVISATATYISVHQMDSIPEGSRELGDLIVKCTTQFRDAARLLKDHRQADKIRAACRSLHYLEHEADVIFRMRLGDLFALERDAIQLIKHKEFLEGLENTVDACATVGTSMEAILIKNG